MSRRHLIPLTMIALLLFAVPACAETTTTAVRKAYVEVLRAVDSIYNANGQVELGQAAAKLDRTCARGIKRVTHTKPRGARRRKARKLALKGLRECRRAADLFAQAAKFPDSQAQHNLRQAGEKALKTATDQLAAAQRALTG